MRVITGTARGCRLETLTGQATRPTAERVKEGLFSAIQFDIPDRRVLDLFAGSGQLGIEALSRGARSCVFVDRNREATEIIRRNLISAKLAEKSQVLTTDAVEFLTRCGDTFDIIFLDPPYGAGMLTDALSAAAAKLVTGGLIVCESDESETLPETAGTVSLYRTYRYGRVHITIYR
jgi:16S rRNA (guanine(966)-N(2))-methyltransferase RsmD